MKKITTSRRRSAATLLFFSKVASSVILHSNVSSKLIFENFHQVTDKVSGDTYFFRFPCVAPEPEMTQIKSTQQLPLHSELTHETEKKTTAAVAAPVVAGVETTVQRSVGESVGKVAKKSVKMTGATPVGVVKGTKM